MHGKAYQGLGVKMAKIMEWFSFNPKEEGTYKVFGLHLKGYISDNIRLSYMEEA